MDFHFLLEELLTELSADEIYQKYYNKIPYDVFFDIVSADPQTQSEGARITRMGKYAKLLISLYQKGGMRIEDTDKAREYLEHVYEHKVALDVNKIKELGDLYNIIKGYIAQDAKTFQEVINVLSKDEYQVLYNGKEWDIYKPLTEKAACYLGVNTEWCTTWGPYSLNKRYRDRGNHFEYHHKKGPLFILIKKNDPEYKFQFHFETKQFMDIKDRKINVQEFLENNREILHYFFPSFIKKVSNEQITKEINRINLLSEDLAQELLNKATKQVNNSLVFAILNKDEDLINKLIKDDQNLSDDIIIKNNKIIFVLRSLSSEMEQVKSNITYYNYESQNGYEFIYNDIRNRVDADYLKNNFAEYLKPYYEENKEIFRVNYGIIKIEEFYDKFLDEFVGNNDIIDAFCSDVAELSAENYEAKMRAEKDEISKFIEIYNYDNYFEYDTIEISISNFVKFLLENNIEKINYRIDTIIDSYISENNLDHEFEYAYDYDIIFPDYVTNRGYHLNNETEKFFSKYINNSEQGKKCMELKEKFMQIYDKFFKGNDFYDTDQFTVKLKKREVDCSDGTVSIQYYNKLNNKTYGLRNEPDKVKIDNLVSLLVNKKLFEQRVGVDKSDTSDIIKSFQNQGHYKWFDYLDPKVKLDPNNLEYALKYGLEHLTKYYGYTLKRVVVRDKGQVVGFLIWSDTPKEIDNIGDEKNYQVLLATAIDPDYRNRGLLRKMIIRAGLQKPYLVQTSSINPIGLWEKMGCKKVKKIDDNNFIEKCN